MRGDGGEHIEATASGIVIHGPRWYVANTPPAREYRSRDDLKRRGFTVFLPECVMRKRLPIGAVSTHKGPLFPNYLFVELDLAHDRWLAVEEETWTTAPVTLLRDGELPKPVPVGLVEEIQRLVKTGGGAIPLGVEARKPRFKPGQRLRIEEGPFEGLTGLFVEGAKERVRLLLDMVASPMAVTLPVALVSPA
jgi:transcription antitermination factor NusG